MADDEGKREARRFEPPPWERDKFEALRQQKEAEARAAAVAEARAAVAEQEPAPAQVSEQAVGASVAGAETPATEDVQADRETVAAAETAAAPAEEAGVVSDAQVGTMLIQLSGEEPKIDRHVKTIGAFSAGLLMFIGLCMIVWGGVLLLMGRGSLAAAVIALTVLAMGGLVGGVGLMLGLRVTRGQGD